MWHNWPICDMWQQWQWWHIYDMQRNHRQMSTRTSTSENETSPWPHLVADRVDDLQDILWNCALLPGAQRVWNLTSFRRDAEIFLKAFNSTIIKTVTHFERRMVATEIKEQLKSGHKINKNIKTCPNWPKFILSKGWFIFHILKTLCGPESRLKLIIVGCSSVVVTHELGWSYFFKVKIANFADISRCAVLQVSTQMKYVPWRYANPCASYSPVSCRSNVCHPTPVSLPA